MEARIKKIYLEGFQSFKKMTEIPIGEITLLYGPNSAGKSAVEDAIQVLEIIFRLGRTRTETEITDLVRLLKRHWRNAGKINSPERPEIMRIGVEFETDEILKLEKENNYFHKITNSASKTQTVRTVFNIEISDDTDFSIPNIAANELSISFTSHLDDEFLIGCEEHESSINFGHRFFQTIKEEKIPKEVEITRKNTYLVHSDGKKEKKKDKISNQKDMIFAMSIWSGATSDLWIGENDYHDFEEKKDHIYNFINIFNLAKRSVIEAYPQIGDIKICTGSRATPKPEDLCFYFYTVGEIEERDDDLNKFNINLNGDPLYRDLASSCLSKIEPNLLEEDNYDLLIRGGTILDDVNQALTEDLFTESGYRVDFNYRFIVDKEDCIEGVILWIFLRDAFGNQHDFVDVGSGIGYVLPVLITLFDGWSTSQYIHQPELHLHPRLQSALGDVFISAKSHTLMVETHSEHILLRILRRIRETSDGTLKDETYAIKPDQVSVLYFFKNIDGTSRVKRIRIADDGDFLDLWPDGFFSERDQDLGVF